MKKILLSTLLILALLFTSSAMFFVTAENDDAGASAGIPEPKFFENFDGADAATKYTDTTNFTAKVENGKLSLTPKNTGNVYFSYPLADGQTLDGSKGLTIAYTFCYKTAGNHSFAGVATNIGSDKMNFIGVNYGAPQVNGGVSARAFWGSATIETGTPTYGALDYFTDEVKSTKFEFEKVTSTYTVVIHIDSAEVEAPRYSIYKGDSKDALVLFGTPANKKYNEVVDTLNGAFGLCVRGQTNVELDSVAIYEDSSVKDSFALAKLKGETPQLSNAQVIAKGLSAEDELELRFLVKFDEAPVDPSAVLKVINPANNEVRETIPLETPARYKGTDLPDSYHVETDYIYLYTIRLNAKQITDKVVISYENNGFVNTEEVSYTIEEYCHACIADANKSEEIKRVCAAILFYGYHAQKAFHYNENNLPVINDKVKALCQIG